MKNIEKLLEAIKKRGLTIYTLSKITGIKYELLRRTFVGKRKLTADELILILRKTDVSFKEIS